MIKHLVRIISSMLSGAPQTSSRIENDEVSYIGKRVISIPSIQFTGKYAVSPNYEWTIAWSDSDSITGKGGYRESGKGSFALIHNGKPCVVGKMERPSLAKVTNNGTFLVNDILFGDNLASVLSIYDNCGNVIISHHFSAKMFSTGISACGLYAACQLCFSDYEDSGKMAFFSIERKELIWKARPYPEWVETFNFDIDKRHLIIEYSKGRRYTIDFDGRPLEAEKYEEDTISSGDLYSAIELLKQRSSKAMDEMNSDEIEINRARFLKLLPHAKNSEPAYPAKIHRYIGEIDEYKKEYLSAIQNYEQAITYDPKVGVKRKLLILQKKVDSFNKI